MSCCGKDHKEQRLYRHTRADFGALTTKPLHFDLNFQITDKDVVAALTATYVYIGKEPISKLELDCKELDVKTVEMYTDFLKLGDSKKFAEHVASLKSENLTPLSYQVDTANHKLVVDFASPVQPQQEFVIKTLSVATPTDNVLEGAYLDFQPEKRPRNIITQCQQYGFQRIVPCIDTMNAKTFYTTTIAADKRYTNILTNGDLAPGYFDPKTNLPVYHPADPYIKDGHAIERHSLKFYNHEVCMAPYLFFLGVGSWDTYRQQVEYPSGESTFIELLVLPGLAKPEHSRIAIQAMHDSILWCNISTGPEMYDHPQEQAEIYSLIKQREELKAKQQPLITVRMSGEEKEEKVEPTPLSESDASKLAAIRARLVELTKVWTKMGYKYTAQVYREIAMENSDYGGMENVGNTTIVSSRMVPSDWLTDRGYQYMEGVKIHEYYHNINGSQVTGQSPFEIWLNEAVTVHVQMWREDDLFGHDLNRLKTVLYCLTPGSGPLALDNAPNSMAVEPEGFNRTQELISAMTYTKAPEFTRMVELIIGKTNFAKGLDHYHTKFANSNATTDDWIHSMEEVSGVSLTAMAAGWLKRTGFPTVAYSGEYDAKSQSYVLSMKQTGFENKPQGKNQPWEMPIDWALVKDGQVTHSGVFKLSEASATLTIPNVSTKPDFVSFARDWSFFGLSKNDKATQEELTVQALSDPDLVNRYLAYRAVADIEKAKVIEGLVAKSSDSLSISPALVELHSKILFDERITSGARALCLREAEDITTRPELAHHYWEIAHARNAILQAVFDAHHDKIIALYNQLEAANAPGVHKAQSGERSLKHHLLSIIVAGVQTPSVLPSRQAAKTQVSVPELARNLLFKSSFMSDKLVGLAYYLQSDAEDREAVMEEVRNAWSTHPEGIENYCMVIGSLDCDAAPRYIRKLMADKIFNISLASHARTIARGWSAVRKRSLLTDEGLDLSVDAFVKIAKVNQMSAQGLLSAFDGLAAFAKQPETQNKLIDALKRMRAGVDPVKEESMYNQLNIMLKPYTSN